MTSAALLEDQFSVDIFVSPASRAFGRPIWGLLQAGLNEGVSTSVTEAEAVALESVFALHFRLLVETINSECAFLSSMHEVAEHPAYREIIEMGDLALPLILGELEQRPDHWFWALREITKENPVLPEHRGVVEAMAQDWIAWGKRAGLRW